MHETSRNGDREVHSGYGPDDDPSQQHGRAPTESGIDAGGKLHFGLDGDADSREEAERAGVSTDPDGAGSVATASAQESAGSGDASLEVVVERLVESIPEEHRAEIVSTILALTQTSSSNWSGLVPPPDEFYKFEPDDRERMMRWNDAGTVDESARQDRLVDAQIEQARKGPNRALAVVLVCLGLAGYAGFGVENTVLAALFLSPPVLMFAQSLISTARSGRTANGVPPENGA